MSRVISITTDLRSAFGTARDQGQRPTCLAFAASDVHAGVRTGGWAPLSCEFLFYHAQRRADRPPTDGAMVPHLLAALETDGQPLEAGWPYLGTVPADWAPPADVGVRYGRSGWGAGATLDALRQVLDAGRPAVMLLKLSASFYRPQADGVVVMAAAEAPLEAVRHAVVAVAHGAVDGQPAILVRNSWGVGWGDAGHAWLTADFVEPRLFGLALLGANSNVPPSPLAA